MSQVGLVGENVVEVITMVMTGNQKRYRIYF